MVHRHAPSAQRDGPGELALHIQLKEDAQMKFFHRRCLRRGRDASYSTTCLPNGLIDGGIAGRLRECEAAHATLTIDQNIDRH